MKSSTLVGVAGSFLVALALFMPLFSVPIFGSINAFKLYDITTQWTFLEIIGVGVLGIIFILLKMNSLFLIISIIAVLDFLINLINTNIQLSKNVYFQLLQLEYGWAFWGLGALLMLISAIIIRNEENNETSPSYDRINTATTINKYVDRDCPKCKKRIDGSFSACPNCGYEDNPKLNIEQKVVKNNNNYWVCKNCGSENILTVDYCKDCGKYK